MSEPDPIDRVKESNGDLALNFIARVGARPYARYVGGVWDIMSLTNVPTPNYGQDDPDADLGIDTRVHVVRLDVNTDEYDEEDIREIAQAPRYPDDESDGYPGVEVVSVEETPFPDREDIPRRSDIVTTETCPDCAEEFRQYHPDPFEECPRCESGLEVDANE